MSRTFSGRPATDEEQQYLDLAAHYFGRAMLCYRHELWPEAETNLGSAMESLLRVRYGSKSKRLVDLIKEFDNDPLFDSLAGHDGETKRCVTCFADTIRVLRNAVHPNCWKEINEKDVEEARLTVIGLYHVLVVCETRIAAFQPSPDNALHIAEQQKVH